MFLKLSKTNLQSSTKVSFSEFDLIILDACYDNNSSFVICPLNSFMNFSIVHALSKSLTPQGSLQVNVLYPSGPSMKEHKRVFSKFANVFLRCFIQRAGGNFVLGCSNQNLPEFTKDHVKEAKTKMGENLAAIFGGDFEVIL